MYSLPQKNLVKCQNPCHNLMHEIEIQVILVYTTISFIHTEIYIVKCQTAGGNLSIFQTVKQIGA